MQVLKLVSPCSVSYPLLALLPWASLQEQRHFGWFWTCRCSIAVFAASKRQFRLNNNVPTSFDLTESFELLFYPCCLIKHVLQAGARRFLFLPFYGGNIDSGLVDNVFLILNNLDNLLLPSRFRLCMPWACQHGQRSEVSYYRHSLSKKLSRGG